MTLIMAWNWEAISAIGQIVGALAVVISLIYLASQVRGSARATRIASERSLVEMFIQFAQQLAVHPHLSELYCRGIHDFESLKGAEVVRFSAFMDQMFKLFEEAYHGQLERHMDARVWRGVDAALRDFNTYPGVQAWWRTRSQWFSEDFEKLINQLQQTAKAPRLFREANADQ
jgi:hypothetical protein